MKASTMPQSGPPAEPEPQSTGPSAAVRDRRTRLHAQIISCLARNGASRLKDILAEVDVCRDTLIVNLGILEESSIIQCDLPKGARYRATPFYSLCRPTTLRQRQKNQVQLTARLQEAADGKIVVSIDEVPGSVVHVPAFDQIPRAAAAAAASSLQEDEDAFAVQVVY